MTPDNDQLSAAFKLDTSKLLGFRNLTELQSSKSETLEEPGLAFNKIGAEVPPASPR